MALSRLGSMRKVADAFGFTTSTVSQQIAAFAKEAGEQLIEPDGRRVRLTPAGRRLADHAVTILAAVDAARLDLDPEAEPLICNDPRPLRAPRQRPRAPGGDRRHRPRCLLSVPRSPLRRAGLVRIFPRIAGIEAAGSGGGVSGPNYAPRPWDFISQSDDDPCVLVSIPVEPSSGLCFTSEHLRGGSLPPPWCQKVNQLIMTPDHRSSSNNKVKDTEESHVFKINY
jgi:hypothetical protein